MCGRYTLSRPERLAERYAAFRPTYDLGSPRLNIAPSQRVAAVKNDGTNHVVPLHWGLIPSWSKDPKIAYRTINARVETVAEKPAFRGAFKRRRCIVFADGYYEWRTGADGKKYPIFFQLRSGEPFAFAGLWESWRGPDSEVDSCTIITGPPNELVASIHDRQPIMLADASLDVWLTPEPLDVAAAMRVLVPFEAADMECWEVSPAVNSARYTGLDATARIAS